MTFCPVDPNSFANTNNVITTHSHLTWSADFNGKVFKGSVKHTFKAVTSGNKIVLDTRFLTVKQATRDGKSLQFEFAGEDLKFGTALTIITEYTAGQVFDVVIDYDTTDKCTATQWLSPAQTVGKVHPYMFSQCQAIHARSLLPCQDTPSVKITYSAQVSVPKPLTALMSAVRTSYDESTNTFHYKQETSIPSYLIAIAIGNLKGTKVGPRSTVWSEPEVVESAAWEFEDTETFIKTGEDLLTPYCWGIYDLLVLPSSFPYGGMENPCLTFVTPTLLAGDRSLVDVVAHEIAHSWMGNLVTTQNWEHFWLNEGFTVFIERKIVGRLHGEPARHFSSIIGYKHLQESVDHFEEIKCPQYSCLCPRLHGEDPDDVFSSVPYEKGFNLLFYLERILGGPSAFEPYVKAHVEQFAHKSITTDDFKTFLYKFFESKKAILDTVDWESWFHKPGMPIVDNNFDNSLAKDCEDLAKKWDEARDKDVAFTNAEFSKFSSNQTVMFLEHLLALKPFPHKTIEQMEATYQFSKTKNCEITFRWQMLCLIANYTAIFPDVVAFITRVGRMKYVRPLYRQWIKADGGLAIAKETFIKHKSFYHPICSGMVSKDLGLA
ncbi:Leukotriene A-4 hydrolase [Boothiomyces sp. JEL0866]|nr:Leukotriene A-4 hydrolase [Boothiomyces sp. JEL0866]